MPNVTGTRVVWAAMICGAIVLAAEPPTIALLRRRRLLDVRLIMRGVPVEAVAGPVALYLADVAWTLQRRVRRGEPWLEAHRTHVYQRWCEAGCSHAEVTVLTSALTVLLCLLGATAMHGGVARATADVAGLGVLAVYLGSPGLFARAALSGAPEAISEMEKA